MKIFTNRLPYLFISDVHFFKESRWGSYYRRGSYFREGPYFFKDVRQIDRCYSLKNRHQLCKLVTPDRKKLEGCSLCHSIDLDQFYRLKPKLINFALQIGAMADAIHIQR